MYLATPMMNVFMQLNRFSFHHVAVSAAQRGRHEKKRLENSRQALMARIPCHEVSCLAQNGNSTKSHHLCSMVPFSYRGYLRVSLRP